MKIDNIIELKQLINSITTYLVGLKNTSNQDFYQNALKKTKERFIKHIITETTYNKTYAQSLWNENIMIKIYATKTNKRPKMDNINKFTIGIDNNHIISPEDAQLIFAGIKTDQKIYTKPNCKTKKSKLKQLY